MCVSDVGCIGCRVWLWLSKAVYGSWKEEVACEFACRKRTLSKGIDSKAEQGWVLSAYSSSLRVVLVAMASATCFAPSALRKLLPSLQMRDESRC